MDTELRTSLLGLIANHSPEVAALADKAKGMTLTRDNISQEIYGDRQSEVRDFLAQWKNMPVKMQDTLTAAEHAGERLTIDLAPHPELLDQARAFIDHNFTLVGPADADKVTVARLCEIINRQGSTVAVPPMLIADETLSELPTSYTVGEATKSPSGVWCISLRSHAEPQLTLAEVLRVYVTLQKDPKMPTWSGNDRRLAEIAKLLQDGAVLAPMFVRRAASLGA